MVPIKFSLCPLCTECPEIEITDQGVRIGEDANTLGCPMPSGMNSSASSRTASFAKSEPTMGRGSSAPRTARPWSSGGENQYLAER